MRQKDKTMTANKTGLSNMKNAEKCGNCLHKSTEAETLVWNTSVTLNVHYYTTFFLFL